MKKITILIVSCFLLISCTNDNDSSIIYFELSQSSFNLNKPQQSVSVHISSNSSWTAIDIPSWVSLQQTQGNGDLDLQILVLQNNDENGQTRTGTIKFISDNKVYLLTIVQTAVNNFTIIIENNFVHHLDYNQNVFTIQVTSNAPWYIVPNSVPTWIQVNPSTGNAGTTSVEITVQANDTNSLRFANIYFTTETPFNPYNNSTRVVLDLDQTFNQQTNLKTWNPTNSIVNGDYRYNLEITNNKLNNDVYLTYNTTTIGSKAYFESYNGVNWNSLNGLYYLYCQKPKLTIDNSGAPYVSYITSGPGQSFGYAAAIKYSDITNAAMGGALSISTVNSTDIALTNNTEMVVVYNDNNNNGKVSVKQKIGSSWQSLGTDGFSVGTAAYCKIAVNSNNEIYVAYSDAGVSNKLVVKKYNGSSWNTVGQLGVSDSGAENIEMEIGSNNEIFVAYKDLANWSKITVKKFSSGNWQTVGIVGFSNGAVNSVSLALDNQNNPYVACLEEISTSDNSPVIKKFDGISWVDLNRIRIVDGGDFVNTATELRIVIGADNIPFIAMKCPLGVVLAKYIN